MLLKIMLMLIMMLMLMMLMMLRINEGRVHLLPLDALNQFVFIRKTIKEWIIFIIIIIIIIVMDMVMVLVIVIVMLIVIALIVLLVIMINVSDEQLNWNQTDWRRLLKWWCDIVNTLKMQWH